MATFAAEGGADAVIRAQRKRELLAQALEHIPDTSRVLVIPPDATRPHSGAGVLTQMLRELVDAKEGFDILPALGTHAPMTPQQIEKTFGPGISPSAVKEHRWRHDLYRFGAVPSEFVHEVSEGVLKQYMPDYQIPIEINKLLVEGGYTAIFSVGQVVPHEVVGMANGVKNILVGCGGQETINKSHFLGAVYGMERMMGRSDTPVRRVFNYAHERYLARLGIIYILTVMDRDQAGNPIMRGLFIGDDTATFERAAALSRQVNLDLLDEPLDRVVVYLDPEYFGSTWLGNKAIYRTRMAMADAGTLIVMAPGVREFGERSVEDPLIDNLIRKYGYRGTPAILNAVKENEDIRQNLAAAAHLIHGSSEGRFEIIYATDPRLLSREEIEGVGFAWMDVREALERFNPAGLKDGPNDGFFYVSDPACGLWALRNGN